MPTLDGALELARAGIETGGAAHNRRFVPPVLDPGRGVPAELITLAHDPQTCGGLLAAIAPERLAEITTALDGAGVGRGSLGRVEPAGQGAVALV